MVFERCAAKLPKGLFTKRGSRTTDRVLFFEHESKGFNLNPSTRPHTCTSLEEVGNREFIVPFPTVFYKHNAD